MGGGRGVEAWVGKVVAGAAWLVAGLWAARAGDPEEEPVGPNQVGREDPEEDPVLDAAGFSAAGACVAKGKTCSSKTTCLEVITLRVAKSRHL